MKQRNEVALVWPFKDCILEGGQSREEDKREEIIFNDKDFTCTDEEKKVTRDFYQIKE